MKNALLHKTSPEIIPSLPLMESEIVRTLLYFDIFSFPLTRRGIYENCSIPINNVRTFLAALQHLVRVGIVKHEAGEYFINGNVGWIIRKRAGALKAKKYLKMAYRMSRLLSNFPFVRGISISGSLSKGVADKNADIDFFIITAPNRLWLCRTLIVLFKKIFLLNSRKWLCPNYFIDDQTLEIPDRNVFTATEIAYLVPTYNQHLLNEFWSANSWVKQFKPNFDFPENAIPLRENTPFLRKIAELLLVGKLGNRLDDFCFRLTSIFWQRKFKSYNKQEFKHAFRSKKNVSKHHPQNFQKQVLQCLEDKTLQFEKDFGLMLIEDENARSR